MRSAEKIEVCKQQRRENRSKVRQALLISEYVRYKHFAVYQEAANFYNEVNSYYPLKHDLRKTDEFKALKMGIASYPKKVTKKKHCHEPIPAMIGNSFTLICEQTASPEQRFECDEQSASPEKPTSPEQRFECDEQPVSPEKPTSPEQRFECDEQSVSPERPTSPEQRFECDEQPVSPERPTSPEQRSSQGKQKVMQLKIPLLEPSVITQTLQKVTDEVLNEKPLQVAAEEIALESTTLYPSLHEEIPNEIIERIINELREDPELQTIMTDIEQDVEFEHLGMELDIPEDRLENELNWESW